MRQRASRGTLAIAVVIAISLSARAGAEPRSAGDDLIVIPSLDELEAVEALEHSDDDTFESELVRSTARVSVPLAEAPGIVTVLRGADIRAAGARTIYDAIRYAPELDVTRDAFGFYHVAVRGRRVDAEVLVLLNGHRINDFYDGRILYEVPISQVERIEILRGPGSSLYGTNAFAGVVSIYTHEHLDRRLQVHLGTSGGDVDRATPSSLWLAGSAGTQLAGWRLHGSLELAHEAGPRLLVPEDSLTRNRMDPDTGASQSRSCDNQPVSQCPDTAYSSLPRTLFRGSVTAKRKPGLLADRDRLSLGAHVLYVDKGPFLGEFDTLTPDTRLRTARVIADARYGLPLVSDGSVQLTTNSFVDLAAIDRLIQVAPDGFKELVEGQSEPFPEGQLKELDYSEIVVRQDLRVRWTHAQRNSLVVGAELEHTRMPHFGFRTNYDDAGRQYDELGNYFDFDLEQDGKSRTVMSVYAEEIYSAPHGIRLVAGGRFDHYSDFGSAVSPRAGAVWHQGDLSLKLFYGWAFRAPTFQELYDQTGRIDLGQYVGNPKLDASRIKTLEGALLYVRSLEHLLLEATLTGSRSSITDSIDRAPLSGLANTFLNTSDISATAASAEIRLQLANRFSCFANASWQSATADYTYIDPAQGVNFVTSSELTHVPQLRFNAGFNAQLSRRYALGLLGEAGGRRKNNQRTPLEGQHFFDYPPYAILQLYAQASRLWNDMYLRVGVRNLTNAQVNDEPFRANRMPLGVPRDRVRLEATLGMDF